MSDLLKLQNISKRNGDINAYAVSSNLIAANTGKDGWGYVKIAVDNATIHQIVISDKYVGALYLVSKEEWEKETAVKSRYCKECERLSKELDRASQLLQDNGFEEESKAIDCQFEL